MSGAVLGAIEVQMLMDLVRWQQDITNSGRMLDTGLGKMKSAISGVMGGLMAGLSVAAFTSWIKGAIDAGDATKEFSQKTGVAAKDVAGLQLAFRQGGVDGEALGSSIGKLSKQMVEGNKAFQTIGVSTRNVDGSMRGVMDVLYDTADAFKGIEDGPAKSALAMEIFGKAGAAMIPTLNEGSDGLREMASMAEKLGLVIDQDTAEAADKFNDTLDLLGQGSQGMARQVAAELLPTLNGLAGALLKNKTEGDGMKKMADAISVALKSLFTVGAVGVEIFSTLGKILGGTAAVLIAVLKGEYSEAWNIAKATAEGVGDSVGGTAKLISDAWDGSGAKSVESMAGMTAGLKKLTPATKDQEAAAKKAAEEQAKLAKAGQDYVDGINAQYGAMQQQISLGRELTEGEKELIKLEEKLASGKMTLTAAERRSAEMKLREIDAQKEQKKQTEDYLKLVAAVAQHSSKWNDEQSRTTDTLRAGNVALIEENEKLRIGAQAWDERQRAVLLNQAADLEWQAANQGGNFQLEEQARLLRERAKLMADGVGLKEAKATADEWKKTTESIQNGLTDALMRAFESGKGFADAFKDTLLNAFRTLILKPMVSSMVGQLSGGVQSGMAAIGNWYSGQTAAGASGGSVGTAGAAAGAGGATVSAVPWIGWAVAGAMKANSDYKEGFGSRQAINSQNEMFGGNFGQWSNEGAISSVFSSLGFSDKWASLLSGATAFAKLLGRKDPRITSQGVAGTFGAGGFQGNLFADWKAEGGLFRSDKTGTNVAPLEEAIGAALKNSAQGMLSQTRAYAKALGLPVESLVNVTSTARIELSDDAEKNAEAINKALGAYSDELVKNYAATLKEVAKPGEAAADTLGRLGEALLNVNSTFDLLGLHLVQTSVAGGKAADELLSLTGGMDAFLAKTQSYLSGYFTQSEQLGLGAKTVLQTLQAAGIDFGGASSRGDLRSLMEQLDPNSASGRSQMAALLNVAGDFAKLTDYLAEQGLTLGQLATQAPAAGIPAAQDAATRSADAAEQSATALQTSNDRLAAIAQNGADTVSQLQALVALQAEASQQLLAQLVALQQAQLDAAQLADLQPREIG